MKNLLKNFREWASELYEEAISKYWAIIRAILAPFTKKVGRGELIKSYPPLYFLSTGIGTDKRNVFYKNKKDVEAEIMNRKVREKSSGMTLL